MAEREWVLDTERHVNHKLVGKPWRVYLTSQNLTSLCVKWQKCFPAHRLLLDWETSQTPVMGSCHQRQPVSSSGAHLAPGSWHSHLGRSPQLLLQPSSLSSAYGCWRLALKLSLPRPYVQLLRALKHRLEPLLQPLPTALEQCQMISFGIQIFL